MGNITGMVDYGRDVALLFPGDRFPVSVGPILRQTGWRGGLWVQYVNVAGEDYVVEVSDGNNAAGFLLPQSETFVHSGPPGPVYGRRGSPADWTNLQYRSTGTGANVVTMVNGGTRGLFAVYETVALAGGTRSGGPITYALNQPLKVSENGWLCNDSDAALALAGVATPIVVGIVSAVPSGLNGNRLGLDMKF